MSAFNARQGLSVGVPPTGVVDATGNGTFGTISGSTITATTQFSGPGTGLTGTAASLTAGAVSSITSTQVTNALGFTPYNATNPSNYITGINSLMVTTALGYTPANVTAIPVVATTNPNMNGTAAIGASGKWADGAHVHPSDTSRQPLNTNLTSIGGLTNAAGWLYNNGTGTFSYSTPTAAQVGAPSLTGTGASGSWGISITGSAATITGVYGGTLTSGQVTTALGYTPYNATNPSGYISANQTVTLTGDVTGSGATAITTTLAAATVTGKVLTGFAVGSAVTVAATDTILAAFGKVQAQLNAVSGALVYQGVWNASTNSPALASGVGTKGYYYKVSVAGSTSIDGISTWKVGDMVVFNGTTWDGIDGVPTEVTTVFGRTGAVVATSGDYTVAQVTGAAPLASPTFTGTPAAPTPLTADNSTTIATTAFVKAQSYLTGNQTITLTGDVTGSGASAITTTLAAATVTGKALTGYTVGTNTAIAATDTILGAFGKLQAQINADGGTVSTVSVVSANGFAGSVATATSTPAITLSTTITGLLKGNGTAISAATASDYVAPSTAPILTGTNFTGIPGTAINSAVANATNATNATVASTVTLADDSTTNTSMVLVWASGTAGNYALKTTSSKLTYNPSSGYLFGTMGLFTGGFRTSGDLAVLWNNSLNNWATNGNDSVGINQTSYQGGSTQFRDLIIYDGKGATVATFTGATKAVTFNGIPSASRFTSTTTTVSGFAPFTVASTNMVANLNVDMLDGYHATAFALTGQTHYVGTTAIAANRSSGAQTLTGVSIDGSAGSVPWSGVTSKPVIKAPLRWFYEAALTTTVLQPAYRADVAGTLKAIRTQSQTPGTGTLLIKINGTTIASYGTLTLVGTDSATAWTDRYTGLSVAIAAGDSITAVCSVAGTAAGVTVQLDIEQTV